ncbi:M-phase inducer phosphatase-like isoform X1 [Mizuhopecten yessoensis]|uniref:M-phase inducer phosphatase n=1 Tax=Mizuhopecten yessoensis TaxID=6573 RepID=A0A210QL61_MIZYE|nr:M-phase inducer phosphatase-like isoform X1 [Mizuhopecten yessoensis]XP_021355519.1 M-phase inducer phosphatase-like isoform X1 [Mizuhopecten yessoensis]OWF49483.1 M-phase inducer phosphatase [Mizuhopecten yessoensis]
MNFSALSKMDYSETSFEFSPLGLLKFEDDEPMDLADVMTPPGKVVHPPPVQDEDSGLGMEFDACTDSDNKPDTHVMQTPKFKDMSQSYCRRRTLFQKSKCLIDDGSISKRPRLDDSCKQNQSRKPLTKSLSFGAEPFTRCEVISAVERLVEEEDLIGNGTQAFCLPIIPGKHSDLKSITSETMSDVLAGKFDDSVSSFRVIDCRYPYEYEGGHIKNAENRYTRDQVTEVLKDREVARGDRRDILIFHCEFSSERGPKMCRFLRNKDREMNTDNYPLLNYPEVYLLHDGYKAFYETKQEMCEPMAYKPMLDRNHADDLRHFRSKSKSWCAGQKKRSSRLMF